MTGKELHAIISFMILVVINGEEHQVDKKKLRVEALLERFHINPETALALRQGELLTEDNDLLDGDVCIIMRTTAER